MRLFSNLINPEEVKDVLFALDSLDQTNLSENLSYELIKGRVRQTVEKNSQAVKSAIIVENHKPLQVALNLIVNTCGQDLRSGFDHTYQGVLSVNGQQKRALFSAAQSMMVDRGFIEEDDARAGREILKEEIEEAG